jgi:hypothetical protein
MSDPTPERLKQLLSYNPEDGILSWLVDRGRRREGQAAGYVGNRGYVKVTIDRKYCLGHRLAWILHSNAPIPPGIEIDHKNGNRSDNKWTNLRLATFNQNRRNARRSNKSGLKGASLHKASGLWVATIKKDKKAHHLGYFKTPEEAHEAYKAAATKLHGEFAKW